MKSLGVEGGDALLIQLKIYPNPASNLLNVEVEAGKSSVMDIEMVDMLGVVHLKTTAGTLKAGYNKFQVNISNLPDGVYFILLKVESGGTFSEYSQRIIIVH